MWRHTSLSLLFVGFACGGQEGVSSLPDVEEPDDRALAILALVNDPYVGVEELDHGVELDARAAKGIVRNRPYGTLEELDAVPYVGPVALEKLYRYAIQNGYLSTYVEPELAMPVRQDVIYDESTLRTVLAENRIQDADAVLTRGKLRFDDGDRILDYEELSLAAASCKEDILAIDGYRWAESVVRLVMETFELEDRLALLAAGVRHDEDQNRYLSLRELERARLEVTSSARG